MKEKIETLHPQGKKGVNIDFSKYQIIKKFIINTLQDKTEIEYGVLNDLAVEKMSQSFEGSIPWYIVTVKLDLEARNIIERIPKTSPHKIRLKQIG